MGKYYCALCETSHPEIKKGISCPECGRRFCLYSIKESEAVGKSGCPYCDTPLSNERLVFDSTPISNDFIQLVKDTIIKNRELNKKFEGRGNGSNNLYPADSDKRESIYNHCPECRSKNIILDNEDHHLCTDCGLVLDYFLEDQSIKKKENNTIERVDITEKKSLPIEFSHLRRKVKIGKMVRSTGELNEYEIVLRGTNTGTSVLKNVIINDFIPKGFSLASETVEDPPVEKEEHSSVSGGSALKWVYEEIQPEAIVEIKYTLRAEGDYVPKEVNRMLIG